ncbi:MAG TPA: glycosyltransferase [bacterium]|nr:glycosyltransferase [bacterium]
MNIFLINSYDIFGGAEKIAYALTQTYHQMGHRVRLIVAHKFSENPKVIGMQYDKTPSLHSKIFKKINQQYSKQDIWKKIFKHLEQPGGLLKIFTGIEKYGNINIETIIDMVGFKPDIVHFHNVRTYPFGPLLIDSAAMKFPIVITLHDLWLLTGKCIQPGHCNEWKNQCRNCPEAWFPSFITKPGISKNFKEKMQWISQSKPYICTPSQWLMNYVKNSFISEVATGLKVIPNGINLSIFTPCDKLAARKKLGLPENISIILNVGKELKTNRYKNFRTFRKIVMTMGKISTQKPLLFLCLGDSGHSEFYHNAEIRFIPFINNDVVVADYYRAADVYVSTATFETWGLTISEAMACGTPVVAFASGGITEQMTDGKTGFLVSPDEPIKMAEIIATLLKNNQLHKTISENALKYAKDHFNIRNTATQYLEVYNILLNKKINEHSKNRH